MSSYLSIVVVIGAISCLSGYRRMPVPVYRFVLVATAVAAGAHFSRMIGPEGWGLAVLSLVGVVTLMAMQESDEREESLGIKALMRSAVRLWRHSRG